MSSDYVYNWAIRRRGATQLVAKSFSRWYGNNNPASLAEGWMMFEMDSWKVDQ